MSLFIPALLPALDSNGNPISGATWTFRRTGTSSPESVYADSELETELGSVVTANSSGKFVPIYLDSAVAYRAILADAEGDTIDDVDPYNGDSSSLASGLAITPAMYGAVPYIPTASYVGQSARPNTGIVDSGAALNEFFAAVSALSNTGIRFDFSGFYGTSIPLVLGTASYTTAGYSARPAISGHMTIVTLAEVGGPALTIRNMDGMSWSGALKMIAGGSTTTHATRHRWAIKLEGATTKQGLPQIDCYGFVYGVTNISNSGDFHFGEWNDIPMLTGWDCGSYYSAAIANAGLTSAFTSVTNNGVDASVSQTATLGGVAVDLPEWVDDVGSPSEQNIAVYISGRMYRVVSFDRAANTVVVKPRMPTGVTSGTLTWWFGGLFVEGGADGSLANIGLLNSTRCATGFNSAAIYPSIVSGRHTSQYDGTPFMFGRINSVGEVGNQFGGGYFQGPYIEEGAGTFDGVLLEAIAGTNISLGNFTMTDFSKLALPAPWAGTAASDILGGGLRDFDTGRFTWEGRSKSYIMNAGYQNEGFEISAHLSKIVFYDPVDVGTIFLEPYDAMQDKLFGVRSRELLIVGTGSNGAPSGTITLNATFYGKTINGSGTATYTGLTKPLRLLITADPATGNFKSTVVN